MTEEELADAILRYQVRLDGVALDTLRLIAADIDAALAGVTAKLDAIGDTETFTYRHLAELQAELTALRQALAARISGTLDETLIGVVETTGTLAADGISAVTARFTEVPISFLLAAKDQPHDGFSWQRWGQKLADDTVSRIESELRQNLATGGGIPDLRRRLQDAADLSKVSAERLARTAVNSTSNRANTAAWTQFGGDWLGGFRFRATLDGRTSPMCRALDGRTFAKNDPKLPRPPRHPNCRSILLPVHRLDDPSEAQRPWVRSTVPLRDMGPEYRRLAKEHVGADGWKSLTTKEKNAEIKAARQRWQAKNVGSGFRGDYDKWFARQPASFQREVLGDVRFRAYKNGLDLGQMATYDRPLSIAELKRLYPDKFGTNTPQKTAGKKPKPEAPPKVTPRTAELPEKPKLDPAIRFAADTSDGFKTEINAAWRAIPARLRQKLDAHGVTVHAPRLLTDTAPDLKGVQPRGWRAGSTWDNADGCYRPSEKQIITSEKIIGRISKKEQLSGRHTGVFRHEAGHAVDDAFGRVSGSADFRKAYDADLARYDADGLDRDDDRYRYFLQSGDAGPSEMFAELFGQVSGGGSSGTDITGRFPDATKWMKAFIEKESKQ